MRLFSLTNKMLNMGGQFYPNGHIVAMFPDEQAARGAAQALEQAGCSSDDVQWLPPEVFRGQVMGIVGDSDTPMPSAGSEAATTRRFAEFAAQGHYGLMIHAPDDRHHDAVMQALRQHQPSFAQNYRRAIIEDIVG